MKSPSLKKVLSTPAFRELASTKDTVTENYRINEDERKYLSRLRKACPDAKINLPEGYFDTDDEEVESQEKKKKKYHT